MQNVGLFFHVPVSQLGMTYIALRKAKKHSFSPVQFKFDNFVHRRLVVQKSFDFILSKSGRLFDINRKPLRFNASENFSDLRQR